MDNAPLHPLAPYSMASLSETDFASAANPGTSTGTEPAAGMPAVSESREPATDVSLEDGTSLDDLLKVFPVDLLPLLDVGEAYSGGVEKGYAYLMYESTVPYEEALDFYRNYLSDKPKYEEDASQDGEVTFHAQILEWQVNLRMMDNEGIAYLEADMSIPDSQ